MKDIQGALYAQIKGHFPCDKRRTELICNMIVGLLKLTQSGLSKWSKTLPGEKELEAKYKQLQRFARYFRFSPRLYCKVIWQLYGQGKQVYLGLPSSSRGNRFHRGRQADKASCRPGISSWLGVSNRPTVGQGCNRLRIPVT